MSDLDNGTLLLSVKTLTGRPPAIRHIHVNIYMEIVHSVMVLASPSFTPLSIYLCHTIKFFCVKDWSLINGLAIAVTIMFENYFYVYTVNKSKGKVSFWVWWWRMWRVTSCLHLFLSSAKDGDESSAFLCPGDVYAREITTDTCWIWGHAVAQLVEALRYKLEGRRFDSPMVSLKFFIDVILPAALWPWGWLSL